MPTARDRRIAYEDSVRNLRLIADAGLRAGRDEEEVARALVEYRNLLKQDARRYDDPDVVRLMEMRNLAKYGDPLGPGPDWLYRKYGSWSAVIDAACRPANLSGM